MCQVMNERSNHEPTQEELFPIIEELDDFLKLAGSRFAGLLAAKTTVQSLSQLPLKCSDKYGAGELK